MKWNGKPESTPNGHREIKCFTALLGNHNKDHIRDQEKWLKKAEKEGLIEVAAELKLDVFDGTPLLDIKPYIKELDSKSDANFGWLEDLDDRDHLMLHIKGIPHEY